MGDGQSNTGKARTKRAAVPNNPKMRKQLRKIASDKKEGMTFAKRKAIRDAKKPKRPTTEFGKEGMALKGEKKGPLEVRYRALAKKIRQCQELEAKKKEGGELDRWQQAKLRKKLFLKAEMKNLKAAVGGEGEEGTEGSDEDEEGSDEDDEDEESEESEEEEVKPPAPKRLKK